LEKKEEEGAEEKYESYGNRTKKKEIVWETKETEPWTKKKPSWTTKSVSWWKTEKR
jgi:hypothetical protein